LLSTANSAYKPVSLAGLCMIYDSEKQCAVLASFFVPRLNEAL